MYGKIRFQMQLQTTQRCMTAAAKVQAGESSVHVRNFVA